MAGESPAVILYDVNGKALAVLDGATIPANTPGLLFMGKTEDNKSKNVLVEEDGKLRASTQPPAPPPGTTPFQLSQDDAQLSITGVGSPYITDSATIGDGLNLYIQIIIAGAQGDVTNEGSKIEIYWVKGATPTEHLISRFYVNGQTITAIIPDINKARDGTQLTGDGSTTKIRIKRSRLSNASQEVDIEVRGYLK